MRDRNNGYFDVSQWEIQDRILRKGRYYVRLSNNGTKKTMPLPNYIWLKENPSFKGIPKGYVVHHLDSDPLNNDISNLVIMHKSHHTAYHFKQLNSEIVPLYIDNKEFNYPERKPTVMYYKSRGFWLIRYRCDGRDRAIYNNGTEGSHFWTREEAEEHIKALWPHEPWKRTGLKITMEY